MNRRDFLYGTTAMTVFGTTQGEAAEAKFTLNLRTRTSAKVEVKATTWDAAKSAIIVVDMWDHHWCKSAERRVGELAKPMNEMIKTLRTKGVFVIHAPSTCVDFYKNTPQRKRAVEAPFAKTPMSLSTSERWGTCWNWPDAKKEGVLPIDDSDMGCDCKVKCEIKAPWTRQIATIEIADADAITDNGQETWNLLTSQKIEHVMICGVHLNMCVLGRPFGIRSLVKQGVNIALIRDMTDVMYNPEHPPGGTHFDGITRVVEHVEKYWCPSFASTDVTGKAEFRFVKDTRK